MPKSRERLNKSFNAVVLKADDSGVVEAIVNVFGIVDYGYDLVKNGAFAKTISERWSKILVLDQHNTSSVTNAIAKLLAIRELSAQELPQEIAAEYPEATGGLWVRFQFMMNDAKSLAIFNRIKAGVVGEYSIGFEIVKQHWEKIAWRGETINTRVIDEVILFEVSTVLFGMNQATATVSAKEYLPDGSVTQRLGDYLAASILGAGDCTINEFLSVGLINQDEYTQLDAAFEAAVSGFSSNLPDELALRPMDMGWGMMWFAASLTQETKEGRTISAANAARLQAAYDALTEIMVSAGLITPPEDEPASEELLEDETGSDANVIDGVVMMSADNPSEQSERDDALLNKTDPARAEPPQVITPALTPEARARKLQEAQTLLRSLGG